uniref:Uncharacterized protein n=1 Tax=Oryza sativa subsp. japonica TaxID=39947 RepID=Q6Z0I1_ORYSJ|nr:hypothetical protein [Oryza sativa Japonica Group]BAD03625.1 hypothetical protein [Oryza sativa Japonica Group]
MPVAPPATTRYSARARPVCGPAGRLQRVAPPGAAPPDACGKGGGGGGGGPRWASDGKGGGSTTPDQVISDGPKPSPLTGLVLVSD